MAYGIIGTIEGLSSSLSTRKSPFLFYQIRVDLALTALGITPTCLERRFYTAQVLHGLNERFRPREVATMIFFFVTCDAPASYSDSRIVDWERHGRIRPGFTAMAHDLAEFMRPRAMAALR